MARRKKARTQPAARALRERQSRPAEGVTPGTADAIEPEALVVSHWFDSGPAGEPYAATIRLHGRLADAQDRGGHAPTFIHEEAIDRVMPGSGPVCLSSWVYGLKPGKWTVTGEVIRANGRAGRLDHSRPETANVASWSWRHWSLGTTPAVPVATRWAPLAPLARIPAVLPGSYTALCALALVVALASQLAILASEQIAVPRSVLVSLLALTAGFIGAKVWSILLHPGESLVKGGWAVDGFLVTAPIVAIAALVIFGLPVGAYLDATAPGLFFAVAIGRIGCFLTGCCAGRVTSSRWGIWSSDRRIGARRLPTQLLESAAGLLIGVAALPLTLLHFRAVHGAVFILAFGVYLVVRQVLLRLREEARRYSWQRSRLLSPRP
jgi:phosphatidylglycerol---prolipoprotein diacylglyceryl transferase